MKPQNVYLGFSTAGERRGPLLYDGDRHVLCFGPSGSGKSTRFLVQNLILTGSRDNFQSAVVIDEKGELCAMTANHRRKHGRVVILNPFNTLVTQRPDLKSDGFNPLAALDPDDEMSFTDDATGHAEAVVRIEGTQPHFPASGQDLWTALSMFVRMSRLGKGGTPADVRRLLTTPSEWHMSDSNGEPDEDGVIDEHRKGEPKAGLALTALEMSESDDEALRAKGSRYLKSTREIDSIVSVTSTQTKFLDSPAMKRDMTLDGDTPKPGVDFADLKRENLTVYVILPANRLRSHSAWLRLVIDAALRAMYATPNTDRPPVNFYIDEAAVLGNLPVLEDAVGLARAFQVRLLMCFQDANQLNDIYEKRYQTFFANAGAVLAFPPRDGFTAKLLSDLAGKRSAVIMTPTSSKTVATANNQTTTSTTTGETPSVVQQPMWRPEELMQLPAGEALLLTVGKEARIIPSPDYRDLPEFLPYVDPNPYHPR